MTQADQSDAMRRALRALAPVGAATPDCLDDGTVAGLADGTIDPARREVVLLHLAGCARCRAAVASVARALSEAEVARETAVLEGTRRGRLIRIAVPLAAAAALLLVLVWPRPSGDGGHRGPLPGANAPVPIAPIGVVADASPLVWTAVSGADRYRVTLSDISGQVLYEVQLVDTTAKLPDSVVLVAGSSYVWLVEARTGFDRWSTSRLVRFSIESTTSPPP